MQVKRSCTLPGNGPSGAESAFRGSAQAVAQAPFYNLGCLDDPADHVGRPVAELAGPIPLSRAELTAALSLTLGLTTDDLDVLSVDDVGRAVAVSVLRHGMDAVQDAAERDLNADYRGDDVLPAFLAACERRVDELLGRPAEAATSETTDEAGSTDTTDKPAPARELVDVAADGW